eukprot:NODE_1710_length_1323_cov_18.184458_g1423_i0.p1 GENE.NODE_1710_length_1323_cov_18.184458_g1423_i0~~NODE_1710_length_1323_cov_18.184458_g1423_i0.p1  ORF type:complete len:370 (+),score=89.04 NODE_1710_length_1323_cov_18.184458_g1423_i0:91-1200(+)
MDDEEAWEASGSESSEESEEVEEESSEEQSDSTDSDASTSSSSGSEDDSGVHWSDISNMEYSDDMEEEDEAAAPKRKQRAQRKQPKAPELQQGPIRRDKAFLLGADVLDVDDAEGGSDDAEEGPTGAPAPTKLTDTWAQIFKPVAAPPPKKVSKSKRKAGATEMEADGSPARKKRSKKAEGPSEKKGKKKGRRKPLSPEEIAELERLKRIHLPNPFGEDEEARGPQEGATDGEDDDVDASGWILGEDDGPTGATSSTSGPSTKSRFGPTGPIELKELDVTAFKPPTSRLRALARLNPNVKTISTQALQLMEHALMLFLKDFISSCGQYMKEDNKKQLMYTHVSRAVDDAEEYRFLRSVLPPPQSEVVRK